MTQGFKDFKDVLCQNVVSVYFERAHAVLLFSRSARDNDILRVMHKTDLLWAVGGTCRTDQQDIPAASVFDNTAPPCTCVWQTN